VDDFARAIESHYPDELRRRTGTGLTLLEAHRAAMAAAVTAVDPENGKSRLRRLGAGERAELEERLLRAVA
jgi:hypothetical protein